MELATRGWEMVTGARVPVIDVPGNHFEPFEMRNVSMMGVYRSLRSARVC